MDKTIQRLLKKINFFNKCIILEQDFRGHSSALRFICELENQKYFVKIYLNDRVNDLNLIQAIYNKLGIPTSNLVEVGYLSEDNKTYAVYEYVEGKTLFELTKENDIAELETIGMSVGYYLARFKSIECDRLDVINLHEVEFKKLIKTLYLAKEKYEKVVGNDLAIIDLDRLCTIFNEIKKSVYQLQPSFIHGDINLHNVIIKNNEAYFIDTDGGKFSFRSLDFRGNCWFCWDGDNKLAEQAMYRGIYKGLFNGNIPDLFHQELAFTIIYEFLLKIHKSYETENFGQMKYMFDKFSNIFIETNYFDNYKFEWME